MPSTRANSWPRYSWSSARQGATPKPQLPAATVVTPWRADGVAQPVPGDLRVVVGVRVDDARARRRARRRRWCAGPARRGGARCPPPDRRRWRRRRAGPGTPVPSTTSPPVISRSCITRPCGRPAAAAGRRRLAGLGASRRRGGDADQQHLLEQRGGFRCAAGGRPGGWRSGRCRSARGSSWWRCGPSPRRRRSSGSSRRPCPRSITAFQRSSVSQALRVHRRTASSSPESVCQS